MVADSVVAGLEVPVVVFNSLPVIPRDEDVSGRGVPEKSRKTPDKVTWESLEILKPRFRELKDQYSTLTAISMTGSLLLLMLGAQKASMAAMALIVISLVGYGIASYRLWSAEERQDDIQWLDFKESEMKHLTETLQKTLVTVKKWQEDLRIEEESHEGGFPYSIQGAEENPGFRLEEKDVIKP